MNRYTAKIEISKSIEVYFDVPLFTGDSGNSVELSFFMHGEPYNMTGVTVSAKRADGQTVFDLGSMSGNRAVYTIANNMHNIPGNLDVQISLSDSTGAFLTSGFLHFSVEKGYSEDSGIEADDRFPIFNSFSEELSKKADVSELDKKANLTGGNTIEGKQTIYHVNNDGAVIDIITESTMPDTVISLKEYYSGEVLKVDRDGRIWKGDKKYVTETELGTKADLAGGNIFNGDNVLVGHQIVDGDLNVNNQDFSEKTPLVVKKYWASEENGKEIAEFYDGDSLVSHMDTDGQLWKGNEKYITGTELEAAVEGCEKTKNKGKPDGYAPLDTAGKIPNEFLYEQTVKEYGVRWKGTSSTVCERLGDAVGLVANAQLGVVSTVQNDFDNIYPWSEMRLCNLDAEGNILAYAGEPTFTRDGTNGDVMVQIPKFYYKREKTAEGYEEWWICAVKLPGYELHPVFIDDGKEVSAVFHSAYNASSELLEDGTTTVLRSISGVQPRVRTTRSVFRNYARNKGAGWSIEDIACVNALQMLYMVEYANTNSQSVLGSGADSLSYTANHKALEETTNGNTITIASTYENVYKLGQRIEIGTSQGANNITTTPRTVTAITTDDETGQTTITFDGDPITIAVGNMIWNVAPLNGSCDDLNGKSGWLAGENNYSDHYADVNYRGIEGFHAKLFRFIDGVNIKDRVVYYANSMADYADGVYDGKYRAVGYSNAEANGYVSAFGYDEKAPWVMFPSAAVGGSSTFVPDYYYQNTGERLLALGGYFYYGANAGAFYFYCSSGFSGSYLTCGAHLLVKKP